MTAVIPFVFDDALVRTVIRDGEPWFVGKDVASVLGYKDTDQAIRVHCKAVESYPVNSTGQVRNTNIIPERDVYRLIMRSKLPAAEAFENWVVSEVLPSLRKTGRYAMADAQPDRQDSGFMNPADRPDITGMVNLLRECRATWGKSAARRLWRQLPLPEVDDAQVYNLPTDMNRQALDEARACLGHLLDSRPNGAETVRDLLTAARDGDDRAAQVLYDHDMRLSPVPDWHGWLAIGNTGQGLTRLFAQSLWAGKWGKTLILLPFARRNPRTVRFSEGSIRAVMLPVDNILK